MAIKPQTAKTTRLDRVLPCLLIVAGIIGVYAAFVITQDKFALLQNPKFVPSCSLNPVISCGSVMKSMQSHVFGFSNTYIGLIGFPVLITTGMAMLAGARFKRWYYLGLNLGALFGVLFCHWLFYQSVYHINALCIYCMMVWTVTIATFWYVTLYNLRHGYLKLPVKLKKASDYVQRHHLDILILWYLIIFLLIMHHFWYYFGRHLPFGL